MEPSRKPQDHPEIAPDIRPKLGVIEGGGESTPDRADLKSAEAAQDLGNQERKFGVIQGGGETTPDRANLKSAEEEAGWDNKTTLGGGNNKKRGLLARIVGGAKKKGPVIAILSVLGLGGGLASIGGITSVFQPNIATRNWYDTNSRVAPMHWRQNMLNLIGNQAKCEGKPTGIRCKLATIADDTLERYQKEGFKLETIAIKDADGNETGRHAVKSITFPDGTKVTNGKDFLAHYDTHIEMASRVKAVSNPLSLALVGKNFSEKVGKKLGIAKNKITITGKDKEEVARSFNKEAGLPDDPKEDATQKTNETKETVDSEGGKVSGKLSKAGNVAAAVCGGYTLGESLITTVKFKNGVKYARFAWPWIKLPDQIRAGDADAKTISTFASALTRTKATGPNAGKSALDSPGFKAMLYGDRPALTGLMQKMLLGGNPALIKIDSMLVKIKELFGARTLHGGCKTVNDPVLGLLLTTALCGAGGAASGTVVPILGNVIGGAGGVVACAAIQTVIGTLSGLIVGKIIEQMMPLAADFFEHTNLSLDDMDPIDLGNVIGMAGGIIFGTVGLANGGKLGTKDEVQNFSKLTYETDRQYEEIARYDARSTPFDATNEYSFMGQIVNKFGLASSTNNPVTNIFTSMGSILSNASLALIPNSLAADMPSPLKEGSLGKCADPQLASKNIACDAVGEPLVIQKEADVKRSTEASLDYMIGNGYVDEDGNVNQEKDYAKYIKYCTGQEPALFGGTQVPIDDDDYIWPETKCYDDDEEISNFRTYTARVPQKEDEDTAYTAEAANAGNSGGTTTGNAGGTTTPGADIAGDDYAAECSKYGAACDGQCVDFVKFRLLKHKVLANPIPLGPGGKDTVGVLGKLGYKVDTTPAVHSVLSVPTGGGGFGHTAMVSQVNADGSIIIEEYNYANPLHYGTRTLTAKQIKDGGLTFAHTEVDYK